MSTGPFSFYLYPATQSSSNMEKARNGHFETYINVICGNIGMSSINFIFL